MYNNKLWFLLVRPPNESTSAVAIRWNSFEHPKFTHYWQYGTRLENPYIDLPGQAYF
jgi:hypothetical protein